MQVMKEAAHLRFVAKNRIRWRNVVEALCITGQYIKMLKFKELKIEIRINPFNI